MFNMSFLALALLHISVPAISIAFFGASPLWLFGGLIFAAATIRALHETDSAFVVTILCMLSGAAFTLTLMLGTCYYMQGEGFNDSFFYHLNIGTLVVASRGYGSVFYPSLLGLLLAFLAPAIIYIKQPKNQSYKLWPAVPVVLLWVLALVGNYPVYSLASYQMSLAAESDLSNLDIVRENSPTIVENSVGSLPDVSTPEVGKPIVPAIVEPEAPPIAQLKLHPKPKPRLKKNIILIYAESLEALYFDTELFGDLVPNIRKLSAKAHRYTNLIQVSGTGWTIAGIVASQCGFPLKVSNHLASNSTMASVDKPYPDETCLADILSDNGYETSYMGGAPLWFAGKENFLRTHGYKRISGDEELASLLTDKKYQSGWGLYDDSLFELALKEIESLEKEPQPYLLTLLTLDTHHPNGIPSKSCKKLTDNGDSMSNAIYCSDQLISNFISEAMKIVDMNDTIIVLFSDHLSLRNTLWDKLKANKQRRRLTFMIFDDTPARVSDTRATHFDVAPTMLEAAGFTDHLRMGVGSSLFAQSSKQSDSGKVVHKEGSTPALLNLNDSAKKSGVAISRRDMSLSIGDLTLKANYHGQKFVSGMYLAVLNEQGNVVDAIYSDDYANLAKNLNGTFVVGVSVMQAPPHSAVYFYGKISPDGKGMTQRAFNHDVYLSAAEIWPPQGTE